METGTRPVMGAGKKQVASTKPTGSTAVPLASEAPEEPSYFPY